MEEENNQDSYTIGTAGKDGAVKVYFNMKTMSDEEIVKLVKRSVGIWKISRELTN